MPLLNLPPPPTTSRVFEGEEVGLMEGEEGEPPPPSFTLSYTMGL